MGDDEGTRAAAAGWDRAYTHGRPPWDIGRPQPAFLEVTSVVNSPVLDVGCGTGENTLAFAALGLEVVGVDVAPSAIAAAKRKAAARGLEATFMVGDALTLDRLGRQFRTVIDCGLFHTFGPGREAVRYVTSVRAVLEADGLLLLMCFSDRQPGTFGPRRVTQPEIRAAFANGWRVDTIEPAVFETRFPSEGAQAWFARIVRLPD